MGGCDVNGNLNQDKFSAPMPWIGIYVAAASLACLIATAADVIHGFRHWKLWFPCKFFYINATSLTLIGVAIKLSVDLNTPMPGRQDQLAKLSSSVLIYTVMGNTMLSWSHEKYRNHDECKCFWNSGYYPYHEYLHSISYWCNLCFLHGACFHHVHHACFIYHDEFLSSPQFVVGRSATCTASGAFCLLSAMILAEAMVRTYWMPWSFTFCGGKSDYKWSTTLVLTVQTTAVAVGTIGPG